MRRRKIQASWNLRTMKLYRTALTRSLNGHTRRGALVENGGFHTHVFPKKYEGVGEEAEEDEEGEEGISESEPEDDDGDKSRGGFAIQLPVWVNAMRGQLEFRAQKHDTDRRAVGCGGDG